MSKGGTVTELKYCSEVVRTSRQLFFKQIAVLSKLRQLHVSPWFLSGHLHSVTMYREKQSNSIYIKFIIINEVSFLYEALSTSMARYIVAVTKTLIISDDKGVIVHDGWIIQQLNIFKTTAIYMMTVCDIWGSPKFISSTAFFDGMQWSFVSMYRSFRWTYCLQLWGTEDGGNSCLCNVGTYLPNYMTLYPRINIENEIY